MVEKRECLTSIGAPPPRDFRERHEQALENCAGLCAVLCLEYAHAVPSFARQTGLSCNVCHSNAPELTAFGRDFRLRGCVLAPTLTPIDKVGVSPALQLSKNIPISFMILLSDTAFQSVVPSAQNNAAGFPQQLSIFLAPAAWRRTSERSPRSPTAIPAIPSPWTTPTCAMPTRQPSAAKNSTTASR